MVSDVANELASGARLGYRPELDGLRAIAILLVISFHYFGQTNPIAGDWLGVPLFFLLSLDLSSVRTCCAIALLSLGKPD